MKLDQTYEELYELFTLEVTSENITSWMKKFNYLATELEYRDADDENLPLNETVGEWKAIFVNSIPFLISPPIARNDVIVRIGLDLQNPFKEKTMERVGINVMVFGVDERMNPDIIKNKYNACIFTEVFGADVLTIFAHWDYVARSGIEDALEKKLIDQMWIDNVFEKTSMMCNEQRIFPSVYSNKNRMNHKLSDLELICRAKKISIDDIIGDEWKDEKNDDITYNSWVIDGKCILCNRIIVPLKKDKKSYYKHARTQRHKINAITYLLNNKFI